MSEFVPCNPDGASRWTQLTALDGVTFQMTFGWNQRIGKWMLSIADEDGVPIISGMLLGTNVLLLRGCIDTRRPAGELVVIDTTGANDIDPGFVDLGSPGARFVLMYILAGEFVA